jgi:hypothetical protein
MTLNILLFMRWVVFWSACLPAGSKVETLGDALLLQPDAAEQFSLVGTEMLASRK